MEQKQIIGRIIGNRPSGKIVVETLDLDIYVLDRFSVVKRLFGETCLFEVPASYDKNREIIKDAVK